MVFFKPPILKKTQFVIFLLILGILLLGCDSNKDIEPKGLDMLKGMFVKEALKRGYNVKSGLDKIKFKYEDLSGVRLGKSVKYWHGWEVSFDEEAWIYGLNDNGRFALFCHEMGHAILNRGHNNRSLPFDQCKSWMRSENYSCSTDIFSKIWIDYYLDELFDSTIMIPTWYNNSPNPSDQQLVVNRKDSVMDLGHHKTAWTIRESFAPNSEDNFTIKIDYQHLHTRQPIFSWKGMTIKYNGSDTSLIIKGMTSKSNVLVDYNIKKKVILNTPVNELKLVKFNDNLHLFFNGENFHVMTYIDSTLFAPIPKHFPHYHDIWLPAYAKPMNQRIFIWK